MLALNPFNATFWEDTENAAVASSEIYASGFSTTIIVIAIVNTIVTLIWEWVCVYYISLWYKRFTDKRFRQLLKNQELEK